MEVQFTADLQARLAQRASQKGLGTEQVVQEVVSQFFEEEDRLIQAIRRGEASLERGEFLSHEQVGEKLARFLRS